MADTEDNAGLKSDLRRVFKAYRAAKKHAQEAHLRRLVAALFKAKVDKPSLIRFVRIMTD